MTVESRN